MASKPVHDNQVSMARPGSALLRRRPNGMVRKDTASTPMKRRGSPWGAQVRRDAPADVEVEEEGDRAKGHRRHMGSDRATSMAGKAGD